MQEKLDLVGFCVISEPIIYDNSENDYELESQNDCQTLNFVKYLNKVGKNMAKTLS